MPKKIKNITGSQLVNAVKKAKEFYGKHYTLTEKQAAAYDKLVEQIAGDLPPAKWDLKLLAGVLEVTVDFDS